MTGRLDDLHNQHMPQQVIANQIAPSAGRVSHGCTEQVTDLNPLTRADAITLLEGSIDWMRPS